MIQLKSLLAEQFGRIDSELIVATTLVLEAGGEGTTGMDAVAHVINNRAKTNHNGWGNTAVKQVLRPYQFSMWNGYTTGKERWTDVLNKAKTRKERGYIGPVSRNENKAAHGGICLVETCGCGATRMTNINQKHNEQGNWN
jgi:hypothetical protein